jgi:hypothetical protein
MWMNRIFKYNEELFWKKKPKKLSKSDLMVEWNKNSGSIFTELISSTPKESQKFYANHTRNLDPESLSNIENYYSKYGVFVVELYSTDSWRSIRHMEQIPSDDTFRYKWWNYEEKFNKLRKISYQLGYKIGSMVTVHPLKSDCQIVGIKNWSYYHSTSESINAIFTLVYEVNLKERLFNINQIDLVTETKPDIIDDTIRDNFLELLDEGIITYLSNNKYFKGGTAKDCKIIINKKLDSNILFKISEQLMVASLRLKDQGIKLDIIDIKYTPSPFQNEITFFCYHE